MRSEAFECVRQRSASGVHWRSAFARRSRGVREAFARRSRRVRDARSKGRRLEAFEGVRKRSEAFKGVRERLACQRFLWAWAGHRMTR